MKCLNRRLSKSRELIININSCYGKFPAAHVNIIGLFHGETLVIM